MQQSRVAHPLAWVLGRGGLLGSHLHHLAQLSPTTVWTCPIPKFAWSDPAVLAGQFAQASAAFTAEVVRQKRSWRIFWAAGGSVVGSSEAEAGQDLTVWTAFLAQFGAARDAQAGGFPGSVFFASSAGGLYAGDCDQPATETSPCTPISPYARSKLKQEEVLRQWAEGRPGARYLIGRISTLYGPGQNFRKQQGIISHLARCAIRGLPLHLFVPQDTVRDFLSVQACAQSILRSMDRLEAMPRAGVTKIFASGRSTTLAQVVAAISHFSPRKPRLLFGQTPASRQQPRRLVFRSQVWPDLDPEWLSIEEGIGGVYRHLLRHFHQGELDVLPPARKV